jgi:hypothetical protein
MARCYARHSDERKFRLALLQAPRHPRQGAGLSGEIGAPPLCLPLCRRQTPSTREGGGRNATGLARQLRRSTWQPTGELSPMAFLGGGACRGRVRSPPPGATSCLDRLLRVGLRRRWPIQATDAPPSAIVSAFHFAWRKERGGNAKSADRPSIPGPSCAKKGTHATLCICAARCRGCSPSCRRRVFAPFALGAERRAVGSKRASTSSARGWRAGQAKGHSAATCSVRKPPDWRAHSSA